MASSRPAFRRLMTLAQGGMGVIELAVREEGRFSRLYAVKRPHPQMRVDPDLRAMFLDEGRLAGLIRHVNVVSVHDVGEDADGPYLVMDYVEGISAAALIKREAARDGRLPLPLGLSIVAHAARGLHAAHEVRGGDGTSLGIVHRDVSPQNLIIGYDGVARVTDFGIAKAYGNVSHTSTGLLKGNVGYMSPEQLRFHEPDRRSDLFSLGVVLYELLAGRRLYVEDGASAVARRILEEPPPDVGELRTDVTPELTGLMFELLAKDRDSRPPDAQEVARRLEEILHEHEAAAGPFDVAAYVSTEFQDVREERARTLAEAEAQLLAGPPRASRRTLGLAATAAALVACATFAVFALRPTKAVLIGADAFEGGPWAGAWHTCAPRRGLLDCWGKNTDGQVGDGETVNRVIRRNVRGLSDVVQVAGGDFHTCALVRGGDVHCWGRNADGELGLSQPEVRVPLKVPGLPRARAVTAGEKHTCVLHEETGQVTCFGLLNLRDAVEGMRIQGVRIQGVVPGISDAVQIAAGEGMTCARLRAGRVLCWGRNDRGQLGDGRQVESSMTPVAVLGLTDAVDIGIGGRFACAVRAGGQVWCWGDNGDEQLGVSEAVEVRPQPAPVPGLSAIAQIAAMGAAACALRRTGQVLCWGRGDWGNLGDGTLGSGVTRAQPVPVTGLDEVVYLSPGSVHMCARRRSGDVLCWGDNANGQIGDGTMERRPRPVSVAASP